MVRDIQYLSSAYKTQVEFRSHFFGKKSVSYGPRNTVICIIYTKNVVLWLKLKYIYTCRNICNPPVSGFGCLEVACWPLVPKNMGSNPAEAVRFFRAKKSSAHLPSEGK